jgi:hypothetical protein
MPTRRRGAATSRRLLLSAGYFPLMAVLTLCPALCAQVGQSMEIQDLSGKGSPIRISGRMRVGHDSANQLPFSFQASFSIKNASPKGILLMVVNLQASNAAGLQFAQEYFFGDAFAPGQVESHDVPEIRLGRGKLDPHAAAQAHAEFVQFADGSTWGDVHSAQSVLSDRGKTLAELDLLEHLYEQKGESAFLDEFARADDTLNVIRTLKTRCRDNPPESNCAHKAVHRTFVTATEHAAGLGSGAAQMDDD